MYFSYSRSFLVMFYWEFDSYQYLYICVLIKCWHFTREAIFRNPLHAHEKAHKRRIHSSFRVELYWSESENESDVTWNGLLLFYAAYLHWSESDVAAKWVATHSGVTSLATFRFCFRSNVIASLNPRLSFDPG